MPFGKENIHSHDGAARGYRPAQEYSKTIPAPPMINIPMLESDEWGMPVAITLNSSLLGSTDEADTAQRLFLEQVTGGVLQCQTNSLRDWEYSFRKEAQQILPFLYLGPFMAAKDRNFIRNEGITLLLAIRNTLSTQGRFLDGSKVANELGIESKIIDVMTNQHLMASFPQIIRTINSHLWEVHQREKLTGVGPSTGKVLMYCETGNERSAASAVAYILGMYDFDMFRAVQIVTAGRFCIHIDDTLKQYLRNFEDILRAKRDVAKFDESQSNRASETLIAANTNGHVLGNAIPTTAARSKRTIDDTYESQDMDVDSAPEANDIARFEGRYTLAPFADD